MMQKKADLSMSTIVMAVLAIIVLVILSSIVITNLGGSSKEFQKCRGVCVSQTCEEYSEDTGINYQTQSSMRCLDSDGKIDSTLTCCLPG